MEKINQLKNLNRMELMGNLKSLVKREKELTLEILDYMQEVSQRKLFLEMGYSSLFYFLTEELGYCTGTAYLRIQTMKALEIPANRERVLNDDVSLNTLAKTQGFITNQNKALGKESAPLLTESEKKELFEAVEGVPAHKAEEVLKKKKHEMDVKKSTDQGLPPPIKKIFKKFNFEADQELVSMIEELKNLLSHSCPNGGLESLLKKALPLAIQEIKIKKGLLKRSELNSTGPAKMDLKETHIISKNNLEAQDVIKPSLENPTKLKASLGDLQSKNQYTEKNKNCISSMKSQDTIKPSEFQANQLAPNSQENQKELADHLSFNEKTWNKRKVTRAIPLELKRKVWKRDGGCCQYQDPKTGKRCHSTYKLEFEHVRPWSFGGGHSLDNLITMCKNHNLYRWDSVTNKRELI